MISDSRLFLTLFLLLLVLAAGCRQPESTELEERLEEQEERIAEMREQLRHSRMIFRELNDRLPPDRRLPESAFSLLNDRRVGLWGADEQAMHFRYVRDVDVARAEALVDTFNAEYDGDFYPGLDFREVEGHTLSVCVREPMQLANQMGSTGAQVYMGAATLTFTSLPGIDSVYFDFGEDFDPDMGSHAGPGVRTRLDLLEQVEEEAITAEDEHARS